MNKNQDPRFKNSRFQSETLGAYLKEYSTALTGALQTVSEKNLEAVFKEMEQVIASGGKVYACGNGGSAAISDHLCCDWMKGTHAEDLKPLKVHNLAAGTALLTALANDFGYEHSFSKQIEMVGAKGDLVVLISSSGNSPNVVEAVKKAKQLGIKTVGMTGFSGGELKKLCDHSLHIPIENYGIVEDGHQVLMHVLAQFLAKKRDEGR